MTNANLAQICSAKGLKSLLNMNPHNRITVSDKLAATMVEAIFGAIAIDSGDIEAVKEAMAALGLRQEVS